MKWRKGSQKFVVNSVSVNFDAERGSARLCWGSGAWSPEGSRGKTPGQGVLGTKSPRSWRFFLQIWLTFTPWVLITLPAGIILPAGTFSYARRAFDKIVFLDK